MSTEADADANPVVVVDVDERFHVRDEDSANWVLRKVTECRAYRERVARWAQAETLRAERQEALLMRRFGGELEAWTREQIGKQHGRAKSLALPAGVLGFRREPTKLLIVDERALVGWCRAHLPAAIKVTESLLKSEIQAHIMTKGECPAGAEMGGGGERFYIR
ncbi:MAG TPA: host-nuclease inhibitor Gam family protein [Tepidisphaeraceae bacterium]|nr:host-nuclease inhibitor Gam family protein [Tepidisphaeraceae bacterium]